MTRSLAAAALLSCLTASAQEPDVASLYSVSTEGTSSKVKPGEKGRVVVEIRPRAGAHVSDEAPLKLELRGTGAVLEKEKLSLADSVGKKAAGEAYAAPRFEVPFTVPAAGKASVDAKLTFFICTDTICARQQRSLALAIETAAAP